MHQVFFLLCFGTTEVCVFPPFPVLHTWLGLTSHGTLIISDAGLKCWGIF